MVKEKRWHATDDDTDSMCCMALYGTATLEQRAMAPRRLATHRMRQLLMQHLDKRWHDIVERWLIFSGGICKASDAVSHNTHMLKKQTKKQANKKARNKRESHKTRRGKRVIQVQGSPLYTAPNTHTNGDVLLRGQVMQLLHATLWRT